MVKINTAMNMTRQVLSALVGKTFGGSRDNYEIFGYNQDPSPEDYRFRYERGDISQRIVDAYPNACWSCPPLPTDDKENQDESPWEKAFREFASGVKLWKAVRAADILAQINEYAIILIGTDDGLELDQPLSAQKRKVTYLRAFGSDIAKVDKWENDQTNPRYGLPFQYKLEVAAKRGESTTQTLSVHYSRVIHIAERTLDDPVYGLPFLKHIWNRLDDLDKVAGGAAEMWWLNGRAGLNLNVDSDVELEDADKTDLKEQVEQYQHNLSRFLRTQGVTVSTLTNKIDSPKDHADLYLMILSGATGIPKRILTGSEMGELASSQDANNFDSRIKERRDNFCEPEVLDPLMAKLTELGVIAKTDFEWVWPELNTISESEKATISKDKAAAIATYSNAPNADTLVSPRQFVEDILGMEYREEELADMLDKENQQIAEDERNLAATKPTIEA